MPLGGAYVRLLEPRASLPDVPDLPGGLSHPAPAVLQWPVPGRPEPAAEGRGPAGERRGDPGPARGGTQQAGGGRLMGRRTFLATVSGSLLAAPLTVEAQNPRRPSGSDGSGSPRLARKCCASWTRSNKNVAFEYRWANGQSERLPDLAAELVPSQGGYYRCGEHARSSRSQASDQHDSHHLSRGGF
jgi:hypothetical protein